MSIAFLKKTVPKMRIFFRYFHLLKGAFSTNNKKDEL